MLKTMIIDDEIYICDLIQHLIDWEALGLTFVGAAYNGVDALDLLLRERPDIAISDIRMPGYNGISLIQEAKTWALPTKFIMISGYKQFEYAQQAIRLGAVDYLLKPMNREELDHALRKVIQICRQDVKLEAMNQELIDHHAILRQQWVQDMVEGRIPAHVVAVADFAQSYALHFEGMLYALAFPMQKEQVDTWKLLLSRLEKKLFAWFDVSDSIYFAYQGRMCWMFSLPESQKTRMAAFYDACQSCIAQFHLQPSCMGVDSQTSQEVHIPTLLRHACTAADWRLLHPSPILHYQANMENVAPWATLLFPESLEQVDAALSTLSVEQFCGAVPPVFGQLFAHPSSSPAAIYAFVDHLLGQLNDRIATLAEENRHYLHRSHVMEELADCIDQEAFQKKCMQIISEHMQGTVDDLQKNQRKPVRVAQQMVEARYMEALGLHDVADAVRLNPVYFSALFKKETGKNFKDYLIEYRIEKAKQFLRESDENITTIAEWVGYKDTKYFSKLFHKQAGVTPSQYRKLYF